MKQKVVHKTEKRNGHYNLTKNHLINYRFYLATIERKKDRLKEIEIQMEGLGATDYSKDKVQNNQVESIMEKMIGEKIQIENELRRAGALVADIDKGMEELEDEEQRVIKMKYIERCSISTNWWQIAKEMGYNKRTCERRRDSAIEKISVVIYGVSN